MDNYMISICIPAYNSSTYIEETIQSVFKQTYKNWEIVIVEDGTNDGTKEIVERLSATVEQKVTYIGERQNRGVSATRNASVRYANYEWIAFLDSDDLWEDNHLETLVATAQQHHGAAFFHSGTNVFDSDTREILFTQVLTEREVDNFPISLFDTSYSIQVPSVMVSKELFFKAGGFDENIRYTEEVEFYFKCARTGAKFIFTGINSCLYRKHQNGLSANFIGITEGAAQTYERHIDWEEIPYSIRKKQVSETWFSVAKLSRKVKKPLAKFAIQKAIKYNKEIRYFLYYGLILLS